MGYLGNAPTTGHFPVQTDLAGNGSTRTFTLDRAPATAGAIEVSIQGVLQPTTAYSVSGTTLTLPISGTVIANTVPIFIRYLGETLTLPTIADGVVTLAKMADNSIDINNYVDASIDDAHLATGISASKLTGSLPALTLAGALTGADQIVTAVNLKDYSEVTNAIGGTGGGTQDIDLTLGNSVSATVDTSTNTFTFSNPTASDEGCGFTLVLTNGGSRTVNWPGTVDWEGGAAPTLIPSGVDILTFWTIDGGTLWHGFLASADSK